MRKYLMIAAVLSLTEIGLSVYLSFWREAFWGSVADRNLHIFYTQLSIFTVAALTYCLVNSVSTYLQTLSSIKWRATLNTKALTIRDTGVENTTQRVQDDCATYPELFVKLVFGFGKAIVQFVSFSIVLVLVFDFKYLIYIIIYAVVSTVLARKIAIPLIALNYKKQAVEATYRNELTLNNFSICNSVSLLIARKTKHLSYFQTFYGQLGVIIPLCIISPAYFNAALTFGLLMQATSVMSNILDNLSYGIYTFNDINRFLSCKKRLAELGVLND